MRRWIKENLQEIYWGIFRNNIRNPILQQFPRTFLFVCKGNVCRSPFAEFISKKYMEQLNLKGRMEFSSAGLEVLKSSPSPEEAIMAAKSYDVNLISHMSRQINTEMLENSDVIFVMEVKQARILSNSFKKFSHKIFLLSLFDNQSMTFRRNYLRYNIPDPYGKSLDQFHECFLKIECCIIGFLSQLKIE
jgi:protein-tyrosine phosphatase